MSNEIKELDYKNLVESVKRNEALAAENKRLGIKEDRMKIRTLTKRSLKNAASRNENREIKRNIDGSSVDLEEWE